MNTWRVVAQMLRGEYAIAHHPNARQAPETVAMMMTIAAADGFEATGDPTFDRQEFYRTVTGNKEGKWVR